MNAQSFQPQSLFDLSNAFWLFVMNECAAKGLELLEQNTKDTTAIQFRIPAANRDGYTTAKWTKARLAVRRFDGQSYFVKVSQTSDRCELQSTSCEQAAKRMVSFALGGD